MLDSSFLRHLAALTGSILEMAVTVILGSALGHWLDQRLGTGPACMLVLALGSLVGGTIRLRKALTRLEDLEKETPEQEQ